MTVPPPPPATPSWLPDPTGRFAHRWFDGTNWTDHVAAADGSQAVDPMIAAPAATWSDPAQQPAQISTWPTQAESSTPSTSSRVPALVGAEQTAPATPVAATDAGGVNWLAIVIAVIGAALLAACLFVLPWMSDGGFDVKFDDLREVYDRVSIGDLPDLADKLTKIYFSWAGYALAAAALITAIGGILRRHRAAMIAPTVLAALAAIYHTYVVVRGGDVEFGVWLAPAGYFVLIVALAVAAAPRRT